ncbi:MAG: DNA polymerase I [Micrococcaceae bacterium]
MSSKVAESKEVSRLLVIDGHSLAFRAFFGVPVDNFQTSTGQYTNAVHGFTSMLINLIRDKKPSHLAVAFDESGPTFRTKEYSEYKAGRSETPEEFKGQIELIRQVLDAMNVKHLSLSEYEADDILATWSQHAQQDGVEVLIVSGDRDTFQLINDDVKVLYPRKGVSDLIELDAESVEEKYLVAPQDYPTLAALVGEKADNLPGVPKVGPKTAAKWIKEYGSFENIINHAADIKGKVGEALREHLDDVKRNKKLNHLITDLKLDTEWEDLKLEDLNKENIEKVFDSLEFRMLRTRLYKVYDELEKSEAIEEFSATLHDGTLNDALKLTKSKHSLVLFPEEGQALGVVIASENKAIPIFLTELGSKDSENLAQYFNDETKNKLVFNAKANIHRLHDQGYPLQGFKRDLYLEAYLAHPERREYKFKDLVEQLGGVKISDAATESESQLTLDLDMSGSEENKDEGQHLAATLAQGIFKAFKGLDEQNPDPSRKELVSDIELPLSQVLAAMEIRGIAVSEKTLQELEDELLKLAAQAEENANSMIAEPVNLASPKQLQKVLFEELNLPKTRKIKSGYSTDIESLKGLLEQTHHEFLINLMAYRDNTKLAQIIAGLKKAVAEDGRIHTTFEQTVAATGRLSSNNPNLQNIPVRSEMGRHIRGAFIAGPNYDELLTADYSQIEMRIMAHLSGAKELIEAFNNGEDLHNYVGAQIFGVEPDAVSAQMRSKVKAMSYGLAYGLSSYGLSKQLEISVDEARTLMNDYFSRFGEVRDYLKAVVDQARQDGYTETMLGRRRYIPDLTSDNYQLRQMAERAALNAPIQGSAADIIKIAMIEVERKLQEADLKSQLLLQIHDELILEITEEEKEQVTEIVKTAMSEAVELSVPLDVNVGYGKNWNEAAH